MDKNKYLCVGQVFFIFLSPGYSVTAQARKLEHEKKSYLKMFAFTTP
jgi:hypothetical protein